MENKAHPALLVLFTVFAAIGVAFTAVSTHDYIAHLDRQVHSVSCSALPGLGTPDSTGESGCYAVMMSPYSALMRDVTWGGIPIALLGLSVFAYLVFLGLSMLLRRAPGRPEEMGYMVAAASLPVLTSIYYWYISVAEIGTVCTNCGGIYLASFGCLGAAIGLFVVARRSPDPERPHGLAWPLYMGQFVLGVVFVFVPLFFYLGIKPMVSTAISRCGELLQPEDKYRIQIPLGGSVGGTPAIEIIDPLCPACKGFKDRLRSSDFDSKLSLTGVLFPLDKTCNWMLSESPHPGACQVSQAVLCAGNNASAVIDWALLNNEKLRALGASDPAKLDATIREQFPAVANCIGKPAVKAQINKSLRWLVANAVPIMTPQLYIRGKRLCAEDSDLGLEFALSQLIAGTSVAARTQEVPQ
ncbi:MAG: hypothetical protein MUC50_00845 [Myxococcota bacterium]|nr:hypothetical protein [Myxococcota bacterium]